MFADDQIEIGVIGHAVAFVGRPAHLRHAAFRVPAPTHVGGHVRKQEIVVDGMPDRPFGEGEAGGELAHRRLGVDQVGEFRLQRRVYHRTGSLFSHGGGKPKGAWSSGRRAGLIWELTRTSN